VKDRGVLRFPRLSEKLPFRFTETGRLDFGTDLVRRVHPELSYHPEEWFNRDDLFSRHDVDDLVKRAVYMTMPRLVAEAALLRDSEVLMVKARRGYSKGYWNLPGGFLDFGEAPEAAVEREVEEEIGADITLESLLGVYHSGFPGKPTYTMGFVYRGHTEATEFRLKPDEIEDVAWYTIPKGLTLTRNPFVRWGLVDLFRQLDPPPFDVMRHGLLDRRPKHRHGRVVFLDRDGVINKGRPGYVRTPEQFTFLDGAIEATAVLRKAGYRLAVVTNQDVVGWKLIPERQLRRIHEKMIAGLALAGVDLEEIYVCPHHILSDCPCRKPRPGLLLAGLRDLNARPWESWMVGDKVTDVGVGKAVGCHTVFVGDAKRRKRYARELADLRPDAMVNDLREAARRILEARPAPAESER